MAPPKKAPSGGYLGGQLGCLWDLKQPYTFFGSINRNPIKKAPFGKEGLVGNKGRCNKNNVDPRRHINKGPAWLSPPHPPLSWEKPVRGGPPCQSLPHIADQFQDWR